MQESVKKESQNWVGLSCDVEWASPEVLADMVGLLNERNLRATFFCTHAGVDVPGHERGLHPNFRRQGDTIKRLQAKLGDGFNACSEETLYKHIIETTHAFAPEAVGVRAHSLYYDSQLLPAYHAAGLQYDSSYAMPLVTGLAPFRKEYDMVELPIYYQDHLDLKMQATGFDVSLVELDRPGMKICNFHPNMVFINATSHEHYMACKPAYHDADKLLKMRAPGKGIRTLFIDLLDVLAKRADSVMTLGEINRRCRLP